MFLAVILVCTTEGVCVFKSLENTFPTRYYCGLAIKDGVDHFTLLPKVDYAEGRCVKWGQLIGDKS